MHTDIKSNKEMKVSLYLLYLLGIFTRVPTTEVITKAPFT